jgi:hypothetical protein
VPAQLYIKNIAEAIGKKSYPTVKMWNRLEGRPVTKNFDRALKAEVRDALWMLSRQWQMGEFAGDDAASPVLAKIHIDNTQLTKYQPASAPVQPFSDELPLEVKVECLNIPLAWNNQTMHLDLRLQLGKRWLMMLSDDPVVAGLVNDFRTKYFFVMPIRNAASDYIYAHRVTLQQWVSVANRMMDGGKLLNYLLQDAGHSASDGITTTAAQDAQLNLIAKAWMLWFTKELYYQPGTAADAWTPEQLEYQAAVSAPSAGKEKILLAEEYYSGHLDWYSFDHDESGKTLDNPEDAPPPAPVEESFTKTFLPVGISFNGMPNTRWWSFEDSKTNFGDVNTGTTDLGKLMLLEFGLIYANDWFVLPFKIPAGSIATIKGMTVTDTFGERFWIEAAGKGKDDNWHRWNMFTMSVGGVNAGQNADMSLLLLPVVPKIQESKPLEEITLIRDEAANMVWAIESAVPVTNGFARPGKELADAIRVYHTDLIKKGPQATKLPYTADISYLAMTTVPENWIPFIPVHVKDSNREIQLQRAAMLRIIDGDPAPLPPKVRPQTTTLRRGLDESGMKKSYFIHEEEVLRAGAIVSKTFKRTRWNNGKVFTWLGMRKTTGRGEGSSQLAFDRIIPVSKPK